MGGQEEQCAPLSECHAKYETSRVSGSHLSWRDPVSEPLALHLWLWGSLAPGTIPPGEERGLQSLFPGRCHPPQ